MRGFVVGVLLALTACAAPPRSTVPPARHVTAPPSRPAPAPINPAAPAPPVSPTRASVVATAKSYLGTPYVYGGDTKQGMDCSGLVLRVMKSHGVSLPRTSSSQYQRGVSVPAERLKPGDLVFFSGRSGGVQHVGIFAGGDRFVHASTHHREVRIDSLQRPYFKKHYLGARDVLTTSAAR